MSIEELERATQGLTIEELERVALYKFILEGDLGNPWVLQKILATRDTAHG